MSVPSQLPVRAPHAIARLSHTFSKSISAADLAEPLASLDENQPASVALELLRSRGLGLLGVRRDGQTIGWVGTEDLANGTLADRLHDFAPAETLDEEASVSAVLGALANSGRVFVEWRGDIVGVIQRRDLQKPPLRMWLFGAITVIDTNLTWAIDELYPGDAWRTRITPGRYEKASSLHTLRLRRGGHCRLVDCLQIKDKADILISDNASLGVLGVYSRREAERMIRGIEALRNHLAHAQELEPEHLATATRIATFIDSILRAEVAQKIVDLLRVQNSPDLKDTP